MSRRAKHLAPIIYLDEIDVLQMAFAAIEMALKKPALETYGLMLGEIESRRRRSNFRVHFVQIIQRAKRKSRPPSVFTDERRLAHLSKRYNLQVIGNFHSHPDNDSSPYPSHADLDEQISRQPKGIFAIILVNRHDPDPAKTTPNIIVRRKTKIVCYLSEFVVHLYFYALKDGLEAAPRNVATERLVRRVYPRCFVRKKIHKDKITKRITVV